MGVGASLRRAVGYFGGSADDEYDDEYDDDEAIRSPEETDRYCRERPDRHGRTNGAKYDEICNDESPRRPGRARQGVIPFAGVRPGRSEFCLVVTREFADAQQIADRLKAETPVIVNMQSVEPELAKRLIDFCSGLTYAIEGRLQRIDDRILLLAPRNADLSGMPTVGLAERGFFNQA